MSDGLKLDYFYWHAKCQWMMRKKSSTIIGTVNPWTTRFLWQGESPHNVAQCSKLRKKHNSKKRFWKHFRTEAGPIHSKGFELSEFLKIRAAQNRVCYRTQYLTAKSLLSNSKISFRYLTNFQVRFVIHFEPKKASAGGFVFNIFIRFWSVAHLHNASIHFQKYVK